MPIQKEREFTRRGFMSALTAATTVVAAPVHANVFGFLKGAGDVRRLRMYSQRTGEMLDTIYWVEGSYIPEAMKEINWFMRDWRRDAVINYDRRNIDIIAASHRLLETDEPFNLLSGYRSPATNAMLRGKNRGVAKNSYHMKGMAADLKLKGRSVTQVGAAARSCNAGGVGRYYGSRFVHMDCGPVRTWKR